MFRVSKRLFEKEWMKFFDGYRQVEIDYVTCLKDLSDPFRVVSTITESYLNSYKDMNSHELMRAASIYSFLTYWSRRRKEKTFLGELMQEFVKRIEVERTIEWTPANIANFVLFAYSNRNFYQKRFRKQTLQQVLEEGLAKIDEFDLRNLSKVTCKILDNEYFYSRYLSHFLDKFNSNLNFHNLSKEQTSTVAKALLIRANGEKVPESTLNPSAVQAFKAAIIKKFEQDHKKFEFFTEISETFSMLDGPSKEEIFNILAEKISFFADVNYTSIDKEMESQDAYIQMRLIKFFDKSHPLAKELFHSVTYRTFMNQVLHKGLDFREMTIQRKNKFVAEYLSLSSKFEVFQIVFLDKSIRIINDTFEQYQGGNWVLTTLATAIRSLAELNYPGRFNTSIPHKETQWEAWQNFLQKSEKYFLSNLFEKEEEREDVEEEEDPNTTMSVVDFLWGMCVFDIYSRPMLQSCLSPLVLNAENITDEATFSRLFQIHYWLKYEYSDEFKLDPQLLQSMYNFKHNWDSQPAQEAQSCKLKNAVKRTLESQNLEFQENFRDFPYTIDFANQIGGKNAILVDNESSFIEGSDGMIRPGFNKVMVRQMAALGWVTKRFSIKNWLKSGHLKLFPTQK